MPERRHITGVMMALAVCLCSVKASAADMDVHLGEVRAAGPSIRASIDVRDIFSEKFRSILQTGGRLHLRVQAELWEERPMWDKLVRPAIVSVFRIIRDAQSQVVVADSVGVVATVPWTATALSLRVEVAPTDAVDDNRKYYLRLVATVGTIEEKELEGTGEAVFGKGESAVSVARVGKVIFNTVLQITDYLQSVTAQLQGPVTLGRDLKRKR